MDREKVSQTADKAKTEASAAKDTAKQKAGQAKEQATQKADAGLDQAASGADKLANTIRSKAESGSHEGAKGAAMDKATVVADKLDQTSQYLREKDSQQLVSDLEDLVRRKPVESVVAAVGVGFLLSKVLR